MDKCQRRDFMAVQSTMEAGWWRRLGGTRQDFLDEMKGVTKDSEIAWGMVNFWAIEEGRYNGAVAPIQLMYQYLKKRHRCPDDPRQCLQDLKHILDTNPQRHIVIDWITSNFPQA